MPHSFHVDMPQYCVMTIADVTRLHVLYLYPLAVYDCQSLGYVNCLLQVDMYSYGVLLWEIVTQEVPSRGQLRDFRVPEECPQTVADLHDACLQQDPSLRPSVSEAIVQLQLASDSDKALHTKS